MKKQLFNQIANSIICNMPIQTAEIFELSVAERLMLVENIWDSIAKDSVEFELSQELRDELDRRMEEHYKNPSAGISWEEMEAKLSRLR